MAVSKMRFVNIIGSYEQLDNTIEALVQSGCYHAEQTAEVMSASQGVVHINEENPYQSDLTKLKDIFRASDITPNFVELKQDFSQQDIHDYLQKMETELWKFQKRRKALQDEVKKIKQSIEQMQHFYELDIDLEKVFSSKFVKVRFGRIPSESYEKLKTYDDNPYVLFFPCSSDGDYYWGMYITPVENGEEVDRIFVSLFFERLWIPDAQGTPKQAVKRFEEQLRQNETEIKELDGAIEKYFSDSNYDIIMQIYNYLHQKFEMFEIRRNSARFKNSFIQVGWVPKENEEMLKKRLDKVDGIEYQIENSEKAEDITPPTKLKNKRPVKFFEYYVEMYGLPGYDEVDPTLLVALTYSLFFGIMFADLGQGIVLAVIGFLMYKVKGMQLGRILIPCGICSAVFGTILGSFFGYENVLDPMFKLLGFHEKPIEVMESVVQVLGLAVGIGVMLIICAMIVNIYSSLKRRDFESGLFGPNGLCGLSIYVSIIAVLLCSVMGVAIPTIPVVIVFIIIPVFLMLMREPLGKLAAREKNWKPESMGGYLLQSFFEVFETLLSYVTNTVSFIRIGAFVLVHTSMMIMFSSIAELVGGGAGGFIVMLIGNAVVIALEGLLVGVQALRLEFYEMFSRFYRGDGRKYKPIAINKI